MKKALFLTIVALASFACGKNEVEEHDPGILPEITIDTSTKQLILTDQHYNDIRIYDQPTRTLLWKWAPADSDLPAKHQAWFNLPDECKPVMDCSCILVTASNGGVALVEIKSGNVLFYACPAKNPHSAEILPDGNIVAASSEGFLTLYGYDSQNPYASEYLDRHEFAGAHNVVWDAKRECLWSSGDSEMRQYSYDGRSLRLVTSIPLPEMWSHDLAPFRDEDMLVMTTGSSVRLFNPETKSFSSAPCFRQADVKSVSFGPMGICTTPTESWWTPEVLNFSTGERVFFQADLQIYKARWRIRNTFSYGK